MQLMNFGVRHDQTTCHLRPPFLGTPSIPSRRLTSMCVTDSSIIIIIITIIIIVNIWFVISRPPLIRFRAAK